MAQKITVEEAADILEGFALELTEIDFLPDDFYCGIGKDMDERSEWHRTHNLEYIKTDTRASAGAVEKEMTRRGFNTGKRPDNGGDEESVYVYIYPITPYTRETSEED